MFDFQDFYNTYSVNRNLLKRDYEIFPLSSKTEKPLKEDLYYLYITLNIQLRVLKQYFNIYLSVLRKTLKEFNIRKDPKSWLNNTKSSIYKNTGYTCAFNVPVFKEKALDTILKRYGTDNPNKSEKIKNAIKQTKLKRYGNKNYNNIKKITKTVKDKYGVNNVFQSNKVKEKIKSTTLMRYGVDNISKNEEIKKKKRESTIKSLGVENPSFSEKIITKIYLKRKANGTLVSSKFEENCYDLLKKKFSDVKRQYKSKEYPFSCDFYISDIDLYIEIQGHISHGKHPFDEKNKDDINTLNTWINRGKLKSSYNDYIKVWTIRDPLKRKIAKENNLNWLEFFNIEDFFIWYNSI